MKKIVRFFTLPVVFILLLAVGNKLLLAGTKFSLAILNPLSAVEYIKASNPSAKDKANSAKVSEDTQERFESPFDSGIPPVKEARPTPSPPSSYDTDHPIVELTYAPVLNSITYQRQNCYIKNLTKLPKSEVDLELLAALDFKVEKNSSEPQILIMHTHATESYQSSPEPFYDPEYTCRTLDTTQNMVSVGEIMSKKLNDLGYNTLHDTTLHDHPSYNASYGRSKATVQEYLEKYPSIKIVLDVHRDAIEKADGTRVKPVAIIQDKKYAQVMLICGADNGYLNMPNYKKNLRFSSFFQNSMETLYPGLTRPILFDYRNYNQQLTTGSVLIEVGSHANTLEEAQNSADLIARALAKMFDTV